MQIRRAKSQLQTLAALGATHYAGQLRPEQLLAQRQQLRVALADRQLPQSIVGSVGLCRTQQPQRTLRKRLPSTGLPKVKQLARELLDRVAALLNARGSG